MIRSQVSERAPPPTASARVEVGAGVLQHALAVGEGVGDALHHRLGQVADAVGLRQADEGAAGGGVVVRRALAGEVGQEGHGRGRLDRPTASPRSAALLAGDARQPLEAVGGREDHPHLVPGVGDGVAEGVHRARRCWARSGRSRRRARPRCRSRRRRCPGATTPTPQAAAALSPAPPATTTGPSMPQRAGELGQELAGGGAALDQPRHVRAREAGRLEQVVGPVAGADVEPEGAGRRPTSPRRGARSAAGGRSPWAEHGVDAARRAPARACASRRSSAR